MRSAIIITYGKYCNSIGPLIKMWESSESVEDSDEVCRGIGYAQKKLYPKIFITLKKSKPSQNDLLLILISMARNQVNDSLNKILFECSNS
jgi:hypothetical protein